MKVIVFGQSKNITYFGKSELQCVTTEKCLKLEMLDKDPKETMTSSFERVYIRKSIFLCSMDEESNHDFIAVFSSKESCDKIYETVSKDKSSQPSVYEDEIFDLCFFIPLIKQVKVGIDGHQDLKVVILDFINSLSSDEELAYSKILAEFLSVPLSEVLENVKDARDSANSAHFALTSEKAFDSSGDTSLNNSKPYNMRKRPLNNISYRESDDEEDGKPKKASRENSNNVSRQDQPSSSLDDMDSIIATTSGQAFDSSDRKGSSDTINLESDDEENDELKTTSRKAFVPFDEPSPQNSPKEVVYDIVEYLRGAKLRKKLLVFVSKERKQCYEYFFRASKIDYRCFKCADRKKCTVVKVAIHANGSKTFDFTTAQHICEPIDYLPSNYLSSLIIKAPNFNFSEHPWNNEMRPLLVVFISEDKSLCYKFGYDTDHEFFKCIQCKKQGPLLTARYIQHDGEMAIELGRSQHVCEPEEYIPKS